MQVRAPRFHVLPARSPHDHHFLLSQFHHDNYCVTSTNGMYSFSNCNAGNVNTTAYHTWANKLFSPDGTFNNCGVNSFARWQALGQDAGSTLGTTPPIADMIAAARAVLAVSAPAAAAAAFA